MWMSAVLGVVRMNEDSRIVEFEEKPMVSQSNTISQVSTLSARRQLIEMLERSADEGRWEFCNGYPDPL